MDINQVTLVGRLADNVEYTAGTDKKASRAVVRLIVNRPPNKTGDKGYDAIQIVGWGVHADNLATYTSKGKEIGIQGTLKVNAIPPTTAGGEWKNYTEVNIQNMTFGRDSSSAKVMSALQGANNTLSAAQAAIASSQNTTQSVEELMAANPNIRKILDEIVQQGLVPAKKLASPAAALLPPLPAAPKNDATEVLTVESPFTEA